MKNYIVLERPKSADLIVPAGFNWYCFCFGPGWGLVTQTWIVFWMYAVMAGTYAALTWSTNDRVFMALLGVICLGWNCFIAAEANEARVGALILKGNRRKSVLQGASVADARASQERSLTGLRPSVAP